MPRFVPVLAASILVSATGGLAAAPADPIAGRDLAQSLCGACHATGRTEASPNPESPPFRDLHKRYPVEDLAESLAEGIVTGHPDMPEVQLTPQAIDNFIAYLKGL
jgi:cytochrome c